MTLSATGHCKSTSIGFVSDSHGTPTQFDRFSVFAAQFQLVVLISIHYLFRASSTVSWEAEDSPDSIPPQRALRSVQTGQNSSATINLWPQPGQVLPFSVFIGLIPLQAEFELGPPSRLIDTLGQLANYGPVPQRIGSNRYLTNEPRTRTR